MQTLLELQRNQSHRFTVASVSKTPYPPEEKLLALHYDA